MPRNLKDLKWDAILLAAGSLVWLILFLSRPTETWPLYLGVGICVVFLTSAFLYLAFGMRAAFRWLTISSAIAALAFIIVSLPGTAANVPIWIIIPGLFGICWVRYLLEMRESPLDSLGKVDLFRAAALAMIIGLICAGMMFAQRYFQKQIQTPNSAVQELIEWQ